MRDYDPKICHIAEDNKLKRLVKIILFNLQGFFKMLSMHFPSRQAKIINRFEAANN